MANLIPPVLAPTGTDAPSGGRVLIVDDEPGILASLAVSLRRRLPGVEVRTAASAEEAMELLARERFDVVLSDQRMPGMQGMDFLAHLRAHVPRAGRVMMTAYPEMDLAVRGLNEVGLEHLLQKPFSMTEAVGVVGKLLEERHVRAQRQRAFARTVSQLARTAFPEG